MGPSPRISSPGDFLFQSTSFYHPRGKPLLRGSRSLQVFRVLRPGEGWTLVQILFPLGVVLVVDSFWSGLIVTVSP